MPHGALLIAFAEAVLGDDDARLSQARPNFRETLGDAALVDAAAVVAFFNAIDRVADATGIPLDPNACRKPPISAAPSVSTPSRNSGNKQAISAHTRLYLSRLPGESRDPSLSRSSS